MPTVTPNQTQLLATVRTVLMFLAGTSAGSAIAHALGITLDASTVTVLAGIIVGLATWAWSLATHTKAATVARAADIVPISAGAQNQVGIMNPQTIPTQGNP